MNASPCIYSKWLLRPARGCAALLRAWLLLPATAYWKFVWWMVWSESRVVDRSGSCGGGPVSKFGTWTKCRPMSCILPSPRSSRQQKNRKYDHQCHEYSQAQAQALQETDPWHGEAFQGGARIEGRGQHLLASNLTKDPCFRLTVFMLCGMWIAAIDACLWWPDQLPEGKRNLA